MSWSGFQLRDKFLFFERHFTKIENVRRTVRKLQIIFGRNEIPFESIVRRLMTKFKTISSVLTAKSPGPKPSCRSEEQLVLVQNSVTVSPKKSIHRSWISRPLHCNEFCVAELPFS